MQDLFTLITQIEVKQIKTNFLSLVGRHNFKGLTYVMSPLTSYKASRNAESLRHFVKEHYKETKISCPARFIYADNPNQGENILKTLGFSFIGLCLLKSLWLHFLHGSATPLSRKL